MAESDAFLDPSVPPASSQVFLDNIPYIQAVPYIETWPEIEDVVNGLLEEAYYDQAGGGEAGELVVAVDRPDEGAVRPRERGLSVARPVVDRERLGLWLMAAPFLVGVIVLVAAPALVTLVMSLFEWDLLQPARFLGLDNFRELLGDVAFRTSLRNSLTYVAIAVPLRVAIALGLALLMHRRMRGVGAERAAGVLPDCDPRRRVRPALALDPEPAVRAAEPAARRTRAAHAVVAHRCRPRLGGP